MRTAKTMERIMTGHGSSGKYKQKLGLLLMAFPFIVHMLVFNYMPLWGWSMAFIDYKAGVPILQSAFKGLYHFQQIFNNGSTFFMVFKNTLIFNALNLAASVVPVIIAVFLAEVGSSKFKRIVQTAISFPHYISWIIVYGIFYLFLSGEGVVNSFMLNAGLVENPVNFLQSEAMVYPLQTFISLWKNAGWSAIIYISAIAGIDQEIYEAGIVDGANKFQRMRYITIPGVMPTFVVILILNTGNILSAFDQYFMFFNPMTANHMEVIDTYAYRKGLGAGNYSYATAVGIFKTAISVCLLTVSNKIARYYTGKSVL